MKIVKGVLQGVNFIPSPNVGGAINPRFITWHYTAGWTAASAISTLTRKGSGVSVQFVVDRDGTITQLVRCDRRAWHAGPSAFMGFKDLNTHSIGVEIVNPGYLFLDGRGGYLGTDPKKTPVPASRLQGYELVEQFHPRIGRKVAWTAYTPAQIEACKRLNKAICDAYDIIASNSHEEIDTRGWKTDPGPLFPLVDFKAMTDRFEGRGGGSPQAPTVTTAVVHASRLNCRETPNGKLVGALLQKGDSVQVVEDRGEWALVKGGAMSVPLWVADKYLDYR
ncbi:1,6-anhydro-N-acetylmuramyl-L-alanine amidase [Citromicrobium phage vB_CbaS-RXM]|nr:1,6-anhydro-N-acetylmuramyl-L-alanine amidase [Citromicrobium phage vB_CbaS-RXM]